MSTEDRLKNLIGSAGTESRASEAEWEAFARKAHGALFTRRAAAVLGTVALAVVVAFAAVSLQGSDDTRPVPPAPAPSESLQPEPEPSETAPATVEVPLALQEIWWVEGEKLSWQPAESGGTINEDEASKDPIAQKAALWLQILALGPEGGPAMDMGAGTAIPEGTEILYVDRVDSVLFVDLSSEFESGGGSLSMQMRVAQVIYTATQFEGIDSARIMIDGEMVDSIGGEGMMVDRPLSRRDLQDFAPNIVVEEPRPGQEFSSGDLVSGFANVFEANVSIVLLFGDGSEPQGKLETFTTATCGSGCWGDFSHPLEFDIEEPMEARLHVLTYSAEDGSSQDLIEIPLMLVP